MEGALTEPLYLQGLKGCDAVRVASAVTLELVPGAAVPYPLVERAPARKARDEAQGEAADEYWCVIDVEAPVPHPRLEEALVLAERHGIKVARSNPCFEVWLILHFADQTGWLTTGDAQALRRQLDGGRGKSLEWKRYEPRVAEAYARARSSAQRHTRERTPCPADNPSSTMPDLLDAVGWRPAAP